MGFLDKLFSREATVQADASIPLREVSKWIMENLGDVEVDGQPLREAFTQADVELALDDRGWLVGAKRMAGELDPLSRTVQVNKSRFYWQRDPLVKQAVRLWKDYTLGDTGLEWDCENDDTSKALIDDFMGDKRNRRLCTPAGQDRLSKRLLVDGELFLCLWDDGVMRDIDCLQITEFITDPDDEDTIWGYKRVMTPRQGTYYAGQGSNKIVYYRSWESEGDEPLYDPAGGPTKLVEAESSGNPVIYHLPLDNLTQRGNPLISCCAEWSREHRKFITARVAITEALAKFAFKGTVKGGQKMLNTVRAKLESTFSQTGTTGGTEKSPSHAPGSTWLQNDGINIEAFPRVTGASEAKTDADNLKLQVCAGTGIAQHYFGDAADANLATATAMELPMLKMFMGHQVLWRGAWRDILQVPLMERDKKASDRADVKLTYPAIIEEDIGAFATFITSLVAAYPEAKTPSLLRQALSSANVPNLDEVMDEIEKNKKTRDANVAAGKNPDGSTPTPIAVAGIKAGDAPGTTPGAPAPTEAESIGQLAAAVKMLSESLR